MDSAYENQVRQQLETLVAEHGLDLGRMMTSLQDELRRIARRQRRQGAVGETLSTTALVNEAYLRFAATPDAFERIDHRHFLAIAARAMKYIVINHARDRVALKRGGGAAHEPLDDSLGNDLAEANRMLELGDALERLEKVRPRLAQVVQLRYFAGLSEDEVGEVLGIDRSTVRRDWLKARGWLYERLHPDATH